MIRAALLALMLAVSSGQAHAACTPFSLDDVETVRASGRQVEVLDSYTMTAFLKLLNEVIDTEIPIEPTRIVISIGDEDARMGFIIGDEVCGIATGPAEGVRELLRQARGHAI